MLADALKFLTELSNRAQHHVGVKIPGRKVLHLIGGQSHEYDDRPGRADKVLTIESLISWVHRASIAYADDLLSDPREVSHKPESYGAEIFVDRVLVAARIGYDSGRIHECCMEIVPTEEHHALVDWIDRPITQKEAISKLRGPLRETCPETLLNVLRRLEFSRKSDGRSTIEHGKESLGRSVEMQARSVAGEIPESIKFDLCLFRQVKLNVSIRCDIDIDSENYTIGLIPFGEDVAKAVEATLLHLAGVLRESLDNVTVMLGEVVSR